MYSLIQTSHEKPLEDLITVRGICDKTSQMLAMIDYLLLLISFHSPWYYEQLKRIPGKHWNSSPSNTRYNSSQVNNADCGIQYSITWLLWCFWFTPQTNEPIGSYNHIWSFVRMKNVPYINEHRLSLNRKFYIN